MFLFKYPLIFIHGIYFGSDEEINLAHNEGFLYELFKDSGLYNLSLAYQIDENETEYGGEDDMEELDNDNYVSLVNDDEDIFAIDKVAQFNSGCGSIFNNSNNKKSKLVKQSSNVSFNTTVDINDFNTEYSSLNSINKQSYCQNYINNVTMNTKSSEALAKEFDSSTVKTIFTKSSNKSVKDLGKDFNDENEDDKKTITAPCDVLATINKWLQKTKDVIELRNKQLKINNR